MEIGIFIALLNPSIALVLATAFLVLWSQRWSQSYTMLLALGYTATSIGFLLQHFTLPIGFYPTKLLSNLVFMISGLLVATAIIKRYHKPVPYHAMAVFSVGGFAAFTWFMYVDPNLTWRIYSTNFALGAIAFLVAAELRTVPNKAVIDRVLFWTSAVTGLNFTARTIFTVQLSGGFETYDGLYTSPYWTSALLTHALFSLVLALSLIMAATSDVFAALRTEADTDPLSGLLNRRGFDQLARTHIEVGRRRAIPLCIVLADLDHFKSVNDLHGHAVGDAVIASFSTLLRSVGGAATTIGRTGGEEFAILVTACDVPMARLLAEGLRTALSASRLKGLPEDVAPITASFGIASLRRDEGLEALFDRADQALYRAKREGRNCVRLADGDAGTSSEVVGSGVDASDTGRSGRIAAAS